MKLSRIKEYLLKGNMIIQLWIIVVFFVIFYDSSLFSNYNDINIAKYGLFKLIVLHTALIVLSTLQINIWKHSNWRCFKMIKTFLKENILLILLLIVYVITSISTLDFWMMYDGNAYYTSIIDNKRWNLGNISDLNLCGHRCFLSSMWMLIGEYIIPNNAVGVRIMILIMVLITISAFYGIIRAFYPTKDKFVAVLVTAVFAYNPLIWSGLAEINIDIFVFCSFVCAVYFGQKNKYVLQLFSLLFMCFSKETGVIIYAGYMLGWVVWNVVSKWSESKGIKNKIINIFNIKYTLAILVGVVYVLAYFLFNNENSWGTNLSDMSSSSAGYKYVKINSFSIWLPYMIHKIKQFLFLNYGWIYGIMFIVIALFWVLKENKIDLKYVEKKFVYILFFVFFAFYNFGMFYITWPNYRYIILWALFEGIIFAVFVFGLVKKKTVQISVCVFMLFITIYSNFYPDILSKYFFNMVDLGNGEMVDLQLFDSRQEYIIVDNKFEKLGYADLGVTNRQYAYRGKCIDKFLKEIDYSNNCLVVFPYIFNDGDSEYIFGRHSWFNNQISNLYVNNKDKKLQVNNKDREIESDESFIRFNSVFLYQDEKLDENLYDRYSEIYYVYFPFNEDEFEKNIFLQDYVTMKEYEYNINTTKCLIYRIK